jgi:hypothetical protein
VGVLAQLAGVADPQLSAVLATHMRSTLATLVVQDPPARQRIAARLADMRCQVPDMLPLTLCMPSGAKPGDSPAFAAAGERAHALQAAACRGADPPLALPLPHTAALQKQRGKG